MIKSEPTSRNDIKSEMIKEILFTLGTVYRTDDMNDYNARVTQSCSYEGYGLYLEAYDLPGYVFNNEQTGELVSTIKKYMNDIIVRYNGKKCFDTSTNFSSDGIWESILIELYNRCHTIKQNEIAAKARRERCIYLTKEIIIPLYNNKTRRITDSIIVESYRDKIPSTNKFGARHYYVVYNKEEVINVEHNDEYGFIIHKYIPGIWEEALEVYKKNYDKILKEKEIKKDNNDGLEYIKQLRRIK